MKGLGLYFQESSKDLHSAGTALVDLLVPGCREVANLSEGASYHATGRAYGHAAMDIFLSCCGVKAVQGFSKMKQMGCLNSTIGAIHNRTAISSKFVTPSFKIVNESQTFWPSAAQGRQLINGIEYSTHALERMAPRGLIQSGKEIVSRGVPPSVVENAIRFGDKIPGNTSDLPPVN